MKVSVITPTGDRERFLKGTYELLKKQQHSDWEWLVYDTSLRPTHFSDPRITYIYDEGIVSIGEKRNRLIEKASGDCIVHFDDDDYYAPTYLNYVVSQLKKASFFTVHSWFSYDTKTRQFFYWDTEEAGQVRYHISALTGMTLKEIEFGPFLQKQNDHLNVKGKAGYGFSFAYTKEVAERCHFEDIDFAEDRHFYESAEKSGFTLGSEADKQGRVIHVLHESNTSAEFPQYRIPRFLVEPLFPPFFDYHTATHEEN